jgi:agmatinase
LLRRYNPIVDTKPFEELSMIDYGDVDVVPGYIEETYARIESTLKPIFDAGIFPIACGGDHSISLGILRAASKKHGRLSLVHYDAHSDCGDIYFGKKYGHGTPFRRALEENLIDPSHSIHVGLRGSTYDKAELTELGDMGFSVISMHEYARIGFTETIKRIKETVVGPAYLSLDIDGVDPAYAPGTGMPEAGGFTSREILDLVRGVQGLPFVGFDLVEVSPPYDIAEITAVLASNLIYEFCSIVAKSRQDTRT